MAKAQVTKQFRIQSEPEWYWLVEDTNLEVTDVQGDGMTLDLYDEQKGEFKRRTRLTMSAEDAVGLRQVLNQITFKGE